MSIQTFLRRSVFIAFVAMMLAFNAAAQLNTATMLGTVTDPTGAAVPGATVTLTQTDTNFTRTITTGADGSYRAEFLPVGPYAARVEAKGFSSLERKGIVLNVTEVATLDLSIAPGGESQTVEVTADIPLVNTGNSVLGRVVDNVEIDNLPLVDRNVYALLDLTPGVQNNSVANPLGFPEQHVKINGSTDSAVGQVSYYLDGGSNMTGLRNTGNSLPNPDAIKEFSVQTNNFSAQFGRSSGGVVTVITKSGTNAFHGSLFEFFRDRNFNAQQHNIGPDQGKTPYNQHRFGGTVGGPIIHDKTFFFGSYAGFRYITANNLVNTVPSAAMRTGNFSENARTDGNTACFTGTGANTQTVAAQSATKFTVCNPRTHTAYPGNIVPLADFDPTIRRIMDAGLIPLPTGIQQTGDTIYTRRDRQRATQLTNEYLGKVEHQLSGKQRLGLSYFFLSGNQLLNPSGNNVLNWTLHTYTFKQHNANAQHTWTINNNMVNQFFLGYTRLIGGRVASPAEGLNAYGSTFTPQGTPSRPQLAVSGWFQAGNAITGPITGNNVYLFRDVLSITKGKHTLFVGGEANLEKDAQQTLLNNYGVFSFAGLTASKGNATPQYSGQVATNGVYLPIRTQAAITDFFFGTPNTMNQDTPVYANANYWNFGLYLQDDWRMSPRLTLNLGVRYDVQTTPLDTQRRTMNFRAGVQSTAVPNAPTGLLFPGDAGVSDGGTPTEYTHISPRVGFAWNPFGDGKTVIHGAGGIFFGTVSGNQFEFPSNTNPYAVRASFSKVISVADPYSSDPGDFCPNGQVAFPTTGYTCTTGVSPFPYNYDKANPRFIRGSQELTFDSNYKWPRIYQVNFGFQQQFTRNLALTANYVGSLSRNMPMFRDANYPIFNVNSSGASGASCSNTALPCAYANNTNTVNNRRPLNAQITPTLPGGASTPTLGQVLVMGSTETSNYHGLQVSAEQRMTHNFSIKGFYVWSKTLSSSELDSGGNAGNSADTQYEDANNRQLEKQRSDFDIRHMSVISAIYKSQYNSKNWAVRSLVNGWTVTAIIRMQSGNPFNISDGSDVNADGQNNDRPNLSGIGTPQLTDNGHSRQAMMKQWVSPQYFCRYGAAVAVTPNIPACPQNGAGPAGSSGTVRRNLLDSPGARSVDASLFREFILHENLKFQLRAESTNVFNLTNLPDPTGSLSSATGFGVINGSLSNLTANSFANRVLQVGGRILF